MPIYRVKSVKIYTSQKKFTRAPLVVLVTNIRYVIVVIIFVIIIRSGKSSQSQPDTVLMLTPLLQIGQLVS